MKFQIIIILFLFMTSVSASFAGDPEPAPFTGFDSGNHFQLSSIEGTLDVTCRDYRGVRDQQQFNCYEDSLSPTRSARFMKWPTVDADKVTLVAYHQDGSIRERSNPFLSNEGRTKKKFNLWNSSLFQRPLLEVGVNRVTYEFEKEGKVVERGEFTATVEVLPTQHCKSGNLFSNNVQNCRSGQMICHRYFSMNNYCDSRN